MNGNMCCEHEDIERAFLNFHKDLWTTPTDPLVDIFDALPTDLPRISDSDAVNLIREATKEEVYLTILDLPTG